MEVLILCFVWLVLSYIKVRMDIFCTNGNMVRGKLGMVMRNRGYYDIRVLVLVI